MSERCFIGIELLDADARTFLRAARALCAEAPSWQGEKWVAEENLHVTVSFLGDIAEEALNALQLAIGGAIAEGAPFRLTTPRIRAVPSERRCRMLWIALDDPDRGCERLAHAVTTAAAPFGVIAENRAFAAHVTLARARRPRPVARAALDAASTVLDGGAQAMSVRSATLFTSRLTPRGPCYRRLGEWPLGGT